MNNKIERDLLISELIYKHLQGELSVEEQEMLNTWLGNPENKDFCCELENTDRLYRKMLYVQEIDIEAHFRRLQQKKEEKRQRSRLPWWLGIAAVLVIGVGTVWLWQKERTKVPAFQLVQEVGWKDRTVLQTPEGEMVYLADTVKKLLPETEEKSLLEAVIAEQLPAVKYNRLSTSSKGKIEVMLSDSSRVWLNAGSELEYPDVFGKDRREVYLRGEAYFEVAKNAGRPFVVNTGENKIEVLGTRFNVKIAGKQHCIATLVEGCIRMHNRFDETVVLRPGQQVETREDGEMSVRDVDYRYDIAWKKNQFGFHEVTLFHIMNELAAWYDFTFGFENITLANQIYTAIVPRFQQADDVLKILQRTGDFVYTQNENGHILIKKNKSGY